MSGKSRIKKEIEEGLTNVELRAQDLSLQNICNHDNLPTKDWQRGNLIKKKKIS